MAAGRLWVYKGNTADGWNSRGVKATGSNYRPGGLPHNIADVDADGNYIYVAVLASSQPQILKMLADLSTDASLVYNPGAGSEVNLMAGDLTPYWIWATGDFGGTNKVVFTEDGGSAWYVQDDGTFGSGAARPLLVGPGNDSLLTTSVGLQLWQNRYEGDTQYWIERNIPGTIWALDRVDEVFEETAIGAYWYTGDSSELVHWSPNSGFNWNNITDSITAAPITSVIIGQ